MNKVAFITSVFTVTTLVTSAALSTPIDSAFGNTVRIETPTTSFDQFYNEDGTISVSDGTSGTWVIEGSKLCTTLDEVVSCWTLKSEHQVGDSWTDVAPNGEAVTLTIIEGR